MPPRENESEQALVLTENSLPISPGEEDILPNEARLDQCWYQKSTVILKHLDPTSLPKESLTVLENLLEAAKNLDDIVGSIENGAKIMKACRVSVRDTMSIVLDEIEVLGQGYHTSDLVSNTVTLSLHRAVQFITTIESIVGQPINQKLETQLQWALNSQEDTENSPLRLSASSPSLAFEMRANTPISSWVEESSSESLPLSASVEPIIFARASDILAGSKALESYQQCHVQIEYCRHKALGYSTGVGMIGEALVRVSISDGLDNVAQGKKKSMPVWGRNNDVGKFRILEARAVQQNAFPRQIQAKLELFVAETYGESGLSVTMKMETLIPSTDQNPEMNIQIVLEPPPHAVLDQ